MESIMDCLGRAAPSDFKPSKGDYVGEDGIWRCGKCHMPKQRRFVVVPGKFRMPPGFDPPPTRNDTYREIDLGLVNIPCKCEEEEWRREDEEREKRRLAERAETLRRDAFDSPVMSRFTFDSDDRKNMIATVAGRSFVDNFDAFREQGKGLLLFGGVGTGKTFLAACIINALVSKGLSCRMTNMTKISNGLFGAREEKQGYIESLAKYDLFCLDDFGVQRDTEWMVEQTTAVIDTLYCAKRPVIFTTNLPMSELKSPCGTAKDRLYSRILQMAVPVKIDGSDRRRSKAREDYGGLMALLSGGQCGAAPQGGESD